MTCIVGLIDTRDSSLWFAADSAGSNGLTVTPMATPKLFIRDAATLGGIIFGYTTSFRMGQILQYHLDIPKYESGYTASDIDRYICSPFIEAVRKCFKRFGYATISDSQESGGQFLVGLHGHIYEIGNYYGVTRSRDAFAAIGSGYQLALGSLASTPSLSPPLRVRMAIDVAATYSPNVGPPAVVLHNN